MKVRILLLDEGFMSGALAAVGLRNAGCDVDVLAAVGGMAACATPQLRWRLGPTPEDPGFDEAVARIVSERPIDVIYPVTEPLQERCRATAFSWRHRVFRAVGEAHGALLADKAALSLAAARHGVSIPLQLPLRDPCDIARAITRLGLPLVVKGTRGRGGSATAICSDARSAAAALAGNRARGIDSIAQQYVHGPTILVGGVFERGTPLRLYAGVKTMQHPPGTGPAVEIRSVHDTQAVDAALTVFAMLGFTGLGSVDLVRGADGVRFLELNPRPWGSLAAARAAGVDCFTPLAALLRGESPRADLHFATGVEARILPLYLLASHYRRHPFAAVRSIARDLRTAQGEPWFPPRQAWHLLLRLLAVQRRWGG